MFNRYVSADSPASDDFARWMMDIEREVYQQNGIRFDEYDMNGRLGYDLMHYFYGSGM